MWKHKNFINLQLWAGPPNVAQTTVIWDSHITAVVGKNLFNGTTGDVTFTNGEEADTASYDGTEYTFEVTLSDGYVIDTITLSNSDTGHGVLTSQSNSTFGITAGYGGISQTITITSKQSTPTLTFKHFYDAGTIGTGTYKFRHYSQQEPSSGETWVLNETIDTATLGTYYINFTTVGTSITNWKALHGAIPPALEYYPAEGDGALEVYSESSNTWTNTAYRTITFATAPTGDLLTWLQANGTKQGGGGSN